jgi:hypothetical protein
MVRVVLLKAQACSPTEPLVHAMVALDHTRAVPQPNFPLQQQMRCLVMWRHVSSEENGYLSMATLVPCDLFVAEHE